MTEFGFIEHIATLAKAISHDAIEGIGDDCAVVELSDGTSLLFTSDMLGEGVHFLRNATTAYELGKKSLMVNLSDIAAMGGKPVATLLSLGLTADAMGSWAEEFMQGYMDASLQYGVALVGGDTTRAKDNISINVTAIGRVPNENVKRRSAAIAKDVIFVGGMLGESAEGLDDILSGRMDTRAAAVHRNPVAQVDEGIWLGQQRCVHAMMDISDGLASDLCHILRASNVSAEIETEKISTRTTIERAVCGGEDYKLLFTVAANEAEALREEFCNRFGYDIYPIGEIVATLEDSLPQIVWLQGGEQICPSWHGFEHF